MSYGATRLKWVALLFPSAMPGNYQRHLEDFGVCTCDDRSGTEPMSLESQDEYGRWRTETVPACADCFGLL